MLCGVARRAVKPRVVGPLVTDAQPLVEHAEVRDGVLEVTSDPLFGRTVAIDLSGVRAMSLVERKFRRKWWAHLTWTSPEPPAGQGWFDRGDGSFEVVLGTQADVSGLARLLADHGPASFTAELRPSLQHSDDDAPADT